MSDITIAEFRQRLSNIKLTANTEEEQLIADDLMEQVLAAISDEDIVEELAKHDSEQTQSVNTESDSDKQ